VLISPKPDLFPRRILFYGENISFDVSLVIYINSTNIPPSMIVNTIYISNPENISFDARLVLYI